MSKLYVVVSRGGEFPNDWEVFSKAFKDLKKAENYLEEMEAEEVVERAISDRCYKCKNPSSECPFYIKSEFWDTDCDNKEHYMYRDKQTHYIQEIECEEQW